MSAPNPNRPFSPHPHEYAVPRRVTATVWFTPQETARMGVEAREGTREGIAEEESFPVPS